jgi:membrane carboxypeptidase/penicillin-binding protein PbpC
MEPKADFWLKGSKVKQEQQFFVNTSEFATRFYWYIDGEFVSNKEDLGWIFEKSGHYTIALTAELGKDGKTSTKETQILIFDWRE